MFQAWAVKMAKMLAHSTPQQAAGEKRQETRHRNREKSQHRHRLQDIEHRQHDPAGRGRLGGDVPVDKGKKAARR